MLSFGSRHWFLALFSLANQSSTKDSDFIWGKRKELKNSTKQLEVFQAKACIWDGSRADATDRAVCAETPKK